MDQGDLSETSRNPSAPAVNISFSLGGKRANEKEAAAKRVRDEAETAAYLEEFVKSFDGESDDNALQNVKASGSSSDEAGRSQRLGAKRYLDLSAPKPRQVPELSNRPGAPPGYKKLKPEQIQYDADEDEDNDMVFNILTRGQKQPPSARRVSHQKITHDDADRQVLHLQWLPIEVSELQVRSMMPSTLKIDSVKLLPPQNTDSKSNERPSSAAIVTLGHETSTNDAEAAVKAVQKRYMGSGYYLDISRHLSIAALHQSMSTARIFRSSAQSLPFGALAVSDTEPQSFSHAPPPEERGRSASYASSQEDSVLEWYKYKVNVIPPSSSQDLKLIHKTIDDVLTHGCEFEALLMSRPEIEQDERYGFLFNARSRAGIYYRWRLWELLSGIYDERPFDGSRRFGQQEHQVFEGEAMWIDPGEELPFEFVTNLEQIASDQDWNSSDEDLDEDDEQAKKVARHRSNILILSRERDDEGIPKYLNPKEKAKLIYLLARLPTSPARLQRGDVIRITDFAIKHAAAGPEVVDMLLRNLLKPFSQQEIADRVPVEQSSSDESDESMPRAGLGAQNQPRSTEDGKQRESQKTESNKQSQPADHTVEMGARQVALYVITDVMSASAVSGVRDAWQYRTLFETALGRYNIVSSLGRMDRDKGWGRMRTEKWQHSLNYLLSQWESESLLSKVGHETIRKLFNQPPLTEREMEDEHRKAQEKQAAEEARRLAQFIEKQRLEQLNTVPNDVERGPTIAEHSEELEVHPEESGEIDSATLMDIDEKKLDDSQEIMQASADQGDKAKVETEDTDDDMFAEEP